MHWFWQSYVNLHQLRMWLSVTIFCIPVPLRHLKIKTAFVWWNLVWNCLFLPGQSWLLLSLKRALFTCCQFWKKGVKGGSATKKGSHLTLSWGLTRSGADQEQNSNLTLEKHQGSCLVWKSPKNMLYDISSASCFFMRLKYCTISLSPPELEQVEGCENVNALTKWSSRALIFQCDRIH